MSFDIIKSFSFLTKNDSVSTLLSLNDVTSEYGITLNAESVKEIIENRDRSLFNNGRIEFGFTVSEKIIRVFCSSPYVSNDTFAETVSELTDIFYYYKSETLEKLSDDELIKLMKDEFDGRCEGSTELLASKALYEYSQRLKGVIEDGNDVTDGGDIYG